MAQHHRRTNSPSSSCRRKASARSQSTVLPRPFCRNRRFSMLRSPLVAIALFAILGPANAADDGCEKFAWSLARERAAFAAADKATVAVGETLAVLPAGAL